MCKLDYNTCIGLLSRTQCCMPTLLNRYNITFYVIFRFSDNFALNSSHVLYSSAEVSSSSNAPQAPSYNTNMGTAGAK